MENFESIWQVGLIALAAGAMIGALAYRLFAPSVTRANKVRSELETARQELIDYRASVNQHFDKTSELVNDLTQNYVKVYQHLAEGAQQLGGSRELNRLLEQKPGKVLLAVDDDSVVREAESTRQAADANRSTGEAVTAAEEVESTESAAQAPEVETGAGYAEKTPDSEMAARDAGNDEQPRDEALKAGTDGDTTGAETQSGGEEKSNEPVIDVSKIERGAAKPPESETELGTLIPDSGGSEEVKPTRH